MKILFYDTKKYDRDSFEKVVTDFPETEIDYLEADLSVQTARLAKGYDAVCAFVSSDVSEKVLQILGQRGVKLVLMRCAGFNNVDLAAADANGITVLRVPGYSPEAVAEHAMALALAVNRHIHKGYIKVRENNFSLVGLTGVNFYGKTAGIVGTGKIGAAMCRICHGFGMKVIAYDIYQNPDLDFVEYVDFDTLLANSDLISLHCPLTDQTRAIVNAANIVFMKDEAILLNLARGPLLDEAAVAEALASGKLGGLGADVVSVEPIAQDNPLLASPNTLLTPHIAWATRTARQNITRIIAENIAGWMAGQPKSVVNKAYLNG